MHSPPNSTHGTVRIDLQGHMQDNVSLHPTETQNIFSCEDRTERCIVKITPAIAIGESQNVVFIVLETRHTACSRQEKVSKRYFIVVIPEH